MRTAPSSVSRKPDSISSTVTISEIAIAINTIARVPAPARMMITGPSAILGRLLSTTRYGSLTRETNGLHHSSTAISTPAAAPSKKPHSVSSTVTRTCTSRPSFAIAQAVPTMREGWLKMKLSIRPSRAAPSHSSRSAARTPHRQSRTARSRRRVRCR